MAARWALEGFADCIARWRDLDDPSEAVVRAVVGWILDDLAIDPFQPTAGPIGPDFPPDEFFVSLPYLGDSNRRVVCWYRIDSMDRVLTCRLISELADPIPRD